MEIRKLKPEENVHHKLMCSICFTRHSSSTEDMYAWLKEPEKHTNGYEHAWGAFDDNGRLISCMQVVPAQIMMNGLPVKTGLICAVTTLPEARNARCVRKMFEIVMSHMKSEGMIFSLLYPFSLPFYRKFGYEHAFLRRQANFPISELSRYPYPDGMKVHDKGGPWADFARVYEAFTQDKNLPMVRGENEWERLLNRDPYKNKEFTYIHYNAVGQPDGYVLYSGVHGEHKTFTMKITELAWVDNTGRNAMLGFIHGLRSEYDEVNWPLASDIDVLSMIDNAWKINLSIDTVVMNRVVDVPAALGLIKAPSGRGRVIIGVTDKFMGDNSGAYSISWENGSLMVEKTGQTPDMEVNVETLVQLISGYLTTAQALCREGVAVHNKTDELSALFPLKNLYLMEQF